ncbi:MAG TPA: hypothetical protein VNE39_14320 [Planctomycetota bacterium]|nr:hypothetical protein [Planctomycetota bacterium]
MGASEPSVSGREWAAPFSIVVGSGLLTAFYVAYLLGLRAAWGREAPAGVTRLPAAAKVLAVFAIAHHAASVAWWASLFPMFSSVLGRGLFSFLPLLSSIPCSEPIAGVLVGGAGWAF